MSKYTDLREECWAANRQLPALGLADLTFGNVSVIDRASWVFAIKPRGVDYDQLTPANLVLLDLEGKIVEGTLRPSSDTPTHARILQAFPAVRCIVHTHSRNATAFAQAGKAIPCFGTTHADYFYGEVPITRPVNESEAASAYELETGNVIIECFAQLNREEVSAVLVHGHAPFIWGTVKGQGSRNSFRAGDRGGDGRQDSAGQFLRATPPCAPAPQALQAQTRRRGLLRAAPCRQTWKFQAIN